MKGFLYNKPDLQALRQAISLTSDRLLVYRNVTNHYNEKGRPDSKVEAELVELAVVPNEDYSVNRKEQGSWSSETFSVSYVYPDYLQLEDIIEHPVYGKLRVTSIKDMREFGVSTARAERINASRNIVNPEG